MFELLVIIICLLLNAVLAGAEIAFVAVNRPLLRQLVRQGDKNAKLLLQLRENPERTLSVVQVGITFVGALAGAVGGAGAEELLSPILKNTFAVGEAAAETIAIGLVVVPLTYFTVVVGELVPKSFALKNTLRFALGAAPWLSLIDRIFGPIVTMFEWSTKQMLTLLNLIRLPKCAGGAAPESSQPLQIGDDVDQSIMLESLSSQHRQYVVNLVNLERKRLKDILLPWKHVTHVQLAQPVDEVRRIILASGHTRVPVFEETEVVGILNTKEFMALREAGGENWSSLVRPVVKLQADAPLLTGLRLLQERRTLMAVVYENRTLLGIVTLEDILEEIVGEIYDEDDDGRLRRILSAIQRHR